MRFEYPIGPSLPSWQFAFFFLETGLLPLLSLQHKG